MTEKLPVRVLLADDDRVIRRLLGIIMADLGAEIVGEAEDGEEVVRLYRQLNPEIVMLDVHMPVMNGDAALKAIRDFDPAAFVVILTSDDDQELRQRCEQLGVKHFIHKTVTADRLYEIMRDSWNTYHDAAREAHANGSS